ncbi:MAG TPA: glycosyltransferase family 2 protein [Lentimicrobium sp.]|nr:glycosyltransferase family 2 protein [Lentimicrobium sp.]
MPEYSIIVPVFNSSESLAGLFQRISQTMSMLQKSFRVIFVDDGSVDRSWEVISSLKADHPDVITAVRLSRNFGQHNATLCGVAHSDSDFVITIDDDLQNPPEEIPRLIETMQAEKADLVYGIYSRKQHSAARNMGSAIIRGGSKKLFQTKGQGSSFRLIKSDLAKRLLDHQLNFVFLDEIFNWYTSHISFVMVEHHKRPHQKSTYTPMSLLSLLTNLLIYYTSVPLQLMVYGGLFSSVISFIVGIVFIYRKVVSDVPLGFTALIVAVLFSTSIILLSLGVIGEYLSRIYLVQNRKPPYSVSETLD